MNHRRGAPADRPRAVVCLTAVTILLTAALLAPVLSAETPPAPPAVALLAGCNRDGGHAETDGHDHAGHNHGDPAEVKDGIAMCAEHGVPESECAVCKPDLAAKLTPGQSMKLRLPSTNSASLVGVQTAKPETGAIADGVECVAEVSFNQNKLAQIAAPVSGIVQTVDVDLGTKVEEKQTVAADLVRLDRGSRPQSGVVAADPGPRAKAARRARDVGKGFAGGGSVAPFRLSATPHAGLHRLNSEPKLRHAYGIHFHWGSWWGR